MILVQAIARLGFSFLQPGSRNFQFQVQFVGKCDDFNQFHQFTIPINNKTSRNAHSFSTLNNEFQSISNIIHNLLDCKNYRYLRAVFVYTGVPRLVRFQLVRYSIQCGLQTALNRAIPRFSAVFFKKKLPKMIFFSKKFPKKKKIFNFFFLNFEAYLTHI